MCVYIRARAHNARRREANFLLKQNCLRNILNVNDLQILLKQNGDFGILLKQKFKPADYQDIAVLLKQNFRAWNILLKQNRKAKHLIYFTL